MEEEMIFDIVINGNPFYEDSGNNFVAVYELYDTDYGVYELVNEIIINDIVDGKKLIKELSQYNSYFDWVDTQLK